MKSCCGNTNVEHDRVTFVTLKSNLSGPELEMKKSKSKHPDPKD